MGRSAGASPQAAGSREMHGQGSGPGTANRAEATGHRAPGEEPAADAPAAEPIRTLIVDDHALFRRGLEMVLESEPGIELVGEAGDGEEAVRVAGESLPDVVLMDIRMPRSSGSRPAGRSRMWPPAPRS